MFGRKKTKLDSKVRFQHRQFTRKLDKARQFKRAARIIPENNFDRALAYIGLGSRWMQIVAGLVILAALYLVYVPNLLTARSVVVSGLSDSDRAVAEAAVRQSIAEASFFNPQHNLLFLSQSRLNQAVKSVPQVYEVNSIKKDFGNQAVLIDVSPKRERFLLADLERVYDVYNDGSLKGVAGINREQWTGEVNPDMVKLRADGVLNASGDEPVFQTHLKDLFESAATSLDNLPGASFGFILLTEPLPAELPDDATVPVVDVPIAVEELKVVLYKGGNNLRPFVVIFDAHKDFSEAARKLTALLGQTAPDRYNNIAYIDMRLEDRGYICMQHTPCDK